MASHILGGLKFKDLMKRAWQESNEDNVFGRAAELAYYFLLALFPMLIFLTSLLAFLPGVQENFLQAVAKVAPGQVMGLVRKFLNDVVSNRSGGLLSFGILATLWASSTGVTALMDTLNAAYDATEGRSYAKQRLIALGLTIGLSLLIVGGTTLIMFGDRLVDWIAGLLGISYTAAFIWRMIDYLLGLALLFIGIEMVYYFGPNVKQKWKWITPGATFAVVAIIGGSLLFSLYLKVGPDYSATYGSLGAVVVLMLWLYLLGLVLLIGGEMNSEIEQALGKHTVERELPDHRQAA